MIGDACVFALTQISNDFACEYGELVTRRAGPDIACHSIEHQVKCNDVYEYLKKIGLAEFEFEDDLTQVPHGIWVKIQFGGLLGLQALVSEHNASQLENISQTITAVHNENQQLEKMPTDQIVESMKNYRSRRRKK